MRSLWDSWGQRLQLEHPTCACNQIKYACQQLLRATGIYFRTKVRTCSLFVCIRVVRLTFFTGVQLPGVSLSGP